MTADPSQRITKAMRLRRRRDFLLVQSSGRKFHGRHVLAVVAEVAATDRTVGRVGLTVTKRVGNAVMRNRIKRRLRDWLRRSGWVPAGLDVVFVAKDSAASSTFAELVHDMERVSQRMAAR